jgi:hypothetical protein
LQLGEPADAAPGTAGGFSSKAEDFDPGNPALSHINIPIESSLNVIKVNISSIPFWPRNGNKVSRFAVSFDGCEPVVCVHSCEEWSHPWKLQVLENRRDFTITFQNTTHQKHHTLTIIMAEPGQIIQKITYGEP